MKKKATTSPQPLKKVISRLLKYQWLLVSITVTLIIILASYFSGKNQISSQQQSTLLLANSAGQYFDNAANAVQALAASSTNQLNLEVVQQSNTFFDSLYVINAKGQLSAIAPKSSQLKVGMDMTGHPSFSSGMKGFLLSKPFISQRTGKPTVYISYPISNDEGMVIGEFSLNGLEENLAVMSLSQEIDFFITDSSGVFLFHPNYEMVEQQQKIAYLDSFLHGQDGIEVRLIREHGKLHISEIAEISQTGWWAITETSILSVYGVIVYPAIIGLILIALLYWVIVRREREVIINQVINPISELDRIALAISQGNFAETTKIAHPTLYTEVATLTSTFEYMQHAIQNHTEELRKSEEKYRTVADFTYDWEAWRLPNGNYRYVSPSCERISGYKAEEFLNNPNFLLNIVIPEDKPILKEHYSIHNNKEICHVDFRLLDIHGNIHWISHWCSPVYGDNGEFIGRRESNRDITDRKAKEIELEKWGQIFEHAEWGIAIGSADGKSIELFNPAYTRMHGYEPEELKGLKIPDLFAPECQPDIAKNIELAHHKGHHVWECLHIHKDGHTFPAVMDVTAVKDEKGDVKYRVVNIQDVSEKRKIENELRLSEAKFSTAFKTSPDSININRLSDGLYIEINEGYTQLTGYTRDDVIGKTSLEINIWVNPEDRKKLVLGLRENGIVNNLEAQFRTKNGAIKTCLMSARVIDVEGEPCILSITRDLTERLQAELLLKESEEKFAKVFHEAPVWISITDFETAKYLDVNEEALRATGFTRDEVIGHTAEEIGFFEKGAREKIINEINEKGRVIDCEMTFHAKNGSLMWGILNAEQLVVNGNKCILTIVNDITSRKQAEESLRESGEYFRASFEYANIGACLVDVNGKFLNVNDEYCRIVGYSHSELLQLTFNDITHPDDRTIGLNVHRKMQANETNQARFEKRYIHKSGEIIWIRISNASVHDAQGDLKYVVAYVQDITDEKKVAQIIRDSEENLKNAQKYARIGSWIWNVKTDQLDWTDEMFRIFGIDKGSFSGRLQDVISRAIHPDDLPKVNESNESVIKNSKPIPVEYRIIWPDGSLHVVWAEAGELVLDEDGRPSLLKGTVQDITERKHLEEEILRSEQKNRLLISQMHQGLAVHEIILDENGKPVDYRFLDVNESFERLTGLKAADLIGKTVLEVLPGTEKSWIEKYGRVALTGEPIEFEDLHSELGKYYGVVAYSPQPKQFAVIISDISDRKQKETEINEQMNELQRWHNVTLGREDRIRELKVEVNQLLTKQGETIRYTSVINDTKPN